MKSDNFWFIAASFLVAVCLNPISLASNDIFFQVSTISALSEGEFDGTMTIKDLREHGNLGLGTFDRLEGEMVELDGLFYQIKADGIAYSVNESTRTPFAEVTFFEPDKTILFNSSSNLTQFQEYLDSQLPSENIFYAFRIDGTFDYVRTRSPIAQSKPYPTLSKSLTNQKIFEFHNQSGTIVGFRCPDYIEGVNVPGYHFHFITANRSSGGHLIDLKLNKSIIAMENMSQFFMVLPEETDLFHADLDGGSGTQDISHF
ncbi:MAG: acetolactate decarboxylase [Methanotrichaceae archaeon]|nr:acetolactate decarboxylase [Methanotrichaceae archaeon]